MGLQEPQIHHLRCPFSAVILAKTEASNTHISATFRCFTLVDIDSTTWPPGDLRLSVLHQSLVHLMDCHYIMLCILEVEMSMLLDLPGTLSRYIWSFVERNLWCLCISSKQHLATQAQAQAHSCTNITFLITSVVRHILSAHRLRRWWFFFLFFFKTALMIAVRIYAVN